MGYLRSESSGALESMTTRVMQDLAESITRMMLLSATVAVLILVGIALFFARKGD